WGSQAWDFRGDTKLREAKPGRTSCPQLCGPKPHAGRTEAGRGAGRFRGAANSSALEKSARAGHRVTQLQTGACTAQAVCSGGGGVLAASTGAVGRAVRFSRGDHSGTCPVTREHAGSWKCSLELNSARKKRKQPSRPPRTHCPVKFKSPSWPLHIAAASGPGSAPLIMVTDKGTSVSLNLTSQVQAHAIPSSRHTTGPAVWDPGGSSRTASLTARHGEAWEPSFKEGEEFGGQ
ncbi:PREDICTED: uncharacterized protein LOC106148786, partial [Chinchilla lanigera]|uniref:uncharacterized protein LOC106148786 n=1 Tax=Chinchilla lanigera TaxID=34839 RepID=UPI000697BF48